MWTDCIKSMIESISAHIPFRLRSHMVFVIGMHSNWDIYIYHFCMISNGVWHEIVKQIVFQPRTPAWWHRVISRYTLCAEYLQNVIGSTHADRIHYGKHTGRVSLLPTVAWSNQWWEHLKSNYDNNRIVCSANHNEFLVQRGFSWQRDVLIRDLCERAVRCIRPITTSFT